MDKDSTVLDLIKVDTANTSAVDFGLSTLDKVRLVEGGFDSIVQRLNECPTGGVHGGATGGDGERSDRKRDNDNNPSPSPPLPTTAATAGPDAAAAAAAAAPAATAATGESESKFRPAWLLALRVKAAEAEAAKHQEEIRERTDRWYMPSRPNFTTNFPHFPLRLAMPGMPGMPGMSSPLFRPLFRTGLNLTDTAWMSLLNGYISHRWTHLRDQYARINLSTGGKKENNTPYVCMCACVRVCVCVCVCAEIVLT